MKSSKTKSLFVLGLTTLGLLGVIPHVAVAQSTVSCPPRAYADAQNYAQNPSFETPTGGNNINATTSTTFSGPMSATFPPSAAADWTVHNHTTGKTGSQIKTDWINTFRLYSDKDAPPAYQAGIKMIQISTIGPEGGINQQLPAGLNKIMISAWVFVIKGQVALRANGSSEGPAAWSTKKWEWDVLRICTDGTSPVGLLTLWNEDPQGGEFSVDRVEVRKLKTP